MDTQKKYYKLGGSASSFTDFTQPTEDQKSLHLGEVKALHGTKYLNVVKKAGGLVEATEEEFVAFEKVKKEMKTADNEEAEQQRREIASKTLDDAKKLRADAEKIRTDNTKLKDQVDDMSDTIDELRTDKATLVERVKALENDVKFAAEIAGNTLQGTINELKGNIDSAVEQNTKLSNDLTAVTGERDTALAELESVKKELADLKKKKEAKS